MVVQGFVYVYFIHFIYIVYTVSGALGDMDIEKKGTQNNKFILIGTLLIEQPLQQKSGWEKDRKINWANTVRALSSTPKAAHIIMLNM